MRLHNDAQASPGGAFAELLRLQGEFQSRIAEETLRYLRRLQGAFAPATPGTVVATDPAVEVSAESLPGRTALLELEVENRQRVHCVVTPSVTPLVAGSGTAWYPSAECLPISTLLGPGEVARLEIRLSLPNDLPPGAYRGAIMLTGFRKAGVPAIITVLAPKPRTGPRSTRRTKAADRARRPSRRGRRARR